jgi:pimeloyl-ACP methyl ester carboxylesterase
VSEILPFTIDHPEEQIEDLRMRLRHTRWPDLETVAGTEDPWGQGTPLRFARELAGHWLEEYDWFATQDRLNRFPQFRTVLGEELAVHFIHARSPHEDALPLLITHGWPGSVVEFHKVIGPLTDPTAHGGDAADAFHVVAPSLPGFGWSDKPQHTGWGIHRIAEAWEELMLRLGYDRFGAQGGDWGAMVTSALGAGHPKHLAGIHVNMAIALPDPETMDSLTEFELDAIAGFDHYQKWDSGYSTQQSTRPQTVGYGLADSPVGQMAWIVEKFWAWTDSEGDPLTVLTPDELLDNVMAYWLTNSAASSARLYWESFRDLDLREVAVPSGISVFPREIFRPSRRWAEKRFTDLRHFGTPGRGGHFAAFEQPGAFVDEVRAAFRTMR